MRKSKHTKEAADLTYFLDPDLEIISLGDEEWLCYSTMRSSRIGGSSARLVIEKIMPLLRNGCQWSSLAAQLPEIEPTQLRSVLDKLVASGILRSNKGPAPNVEPTLSPLLALLDALQIPVDVAMARLANTRVAIIGLEGGGGHLALLLAQYGLRRFTLVDPYPCQPGNLPLLPLAGRAAIGQPRQILVAQALRDTKLDSQNMDITLGPSHLSPELVADIVSNSDCVVSCFDRGFAAIHHWVNRACLRAGVPAVYAEAIGHHGWAGPLVLPHRTACYMCYRMRAIACAVDSTAALALERHFDRQSRPQLHARPVLPSLMPQLAGLLATAVLQVVLGLEQPVLAGRVLECQALTLKMATHPVLQQPDCPDCGGANPTGSAHHPDLAELLSGNDSPVDLLQIAPELVSPHTGIIRELRWYKKDTSEPSIPYICEVTLANYHFRTDVAVVHLTGWGKGPTHSQARASGLGEALERYSGDRVDPRAIVYARRAELDGPSVNPTDLVLYTPEQYATLPYHPYEETNILGWVPGLSLVSGERMYIPALAAFLGYQAQSPEEYLFPVTSNGLAVGASLVRAILAAAYEVMERDALMITWFARLPTRRVDPLTHPDEVIRDLCKAYWRRGVEIALWRLPTDHPCAVFLAMGIQQADKQGPAVVAGFGADLSPAAAARKAILEVGQIRPAYRRSLRRPDVLQRLAELVQDPQSVATMHDHGLLYCSPAMRPALAFLLDRLPEPPDWDPLDPGNPGMQLEQLVAFCRASRRDFIYYNMTPPDLAQLGLAATRVIIPGFQPIAFGAQEPRLGGTRLYELPQQLGLAPARLTPEDLNPYPHLFD
jgi:bacteriocin biosynthesis cyclodehydratase domain-containing protein